MIAVTGATGTVGSALVALLAERGEPVRALTRRPQAWGGPAVEVVDDPRAAFTGAGAAFLMSAERVVADQPPRRLPALVDAAVSAGVGHLVVLSVFSGGDGDDPIGRWHAATEGAVTGSGIPATLLRPGRFFSNALHWARPVRAGLPVPVAFARRAAAGIDPADVAAVAAASFADPTTTAGTAPRLTGPESLTPLDELALLAEALGRRIDAVEVPVDDTRRGMLAHGEAPEVVDAIVARTVGGDEGTDPLPTVADLLGRPPRRFADWAVEHRSAFLPGDRA